MGVVTSLVGVVRVDVGLSVGDEEVVAGDGGGDMAVVCTVLPVNTVLD